MATLAQVPSQRSTIQTKDFFNITSKEVPDDEDSPLEQQNSPLPPPSNIPAKILDLDKLTPDKHVPRDPRLIRLTGVHPFNAEAPLTELFNQGI